MFISTWLREHLVPDGLAEHHFYFSMCGRHGRLQLCGDPHIDSEYFDSWLELLPRLQSALSARDYQELVERLAVATDLIGYRPLTSLQDQMA